MNTITVSQLGKEEEEEESSLSHVEKNYKFDSTLASWLAVLPAATILLTIIIDIVPLLAHKPSPELMRQVILPARIPACAPEPGEQLAYLSAILMFPIIFSISIFIIRKLEKLSVSFRISKLLNTTLFAGALGAQVLLCRFVVTNIMPERQLLAPLFLNGIVYLVLGLLVIIIATKAFNNKLNYLGSAANLVSAILPCFLAFVYVILRTLPSLVIDPCRWNLIAADHLGSTMGEFAALINGRTDLIDFFAQYSHIMQYVLAPYFFAFGLSPLTYSLIMTILTCTSLMMVFAIFRLLTGKFSLALCFFIPFCAASFFPLQDEQLAQPTFANYFAAMPIRYFGPILVALLTSIYLHQKSTIKLVILFFVGSLVAINNLDFGVPALVGSLAAVLFSMKELQIKKIVFVFGAFSGSLPAALITFLALVYLRSGQLPNITYLFTYQSVFMKYGMSMLPMEFYGIHWLLFITYMANICLAVIESTRKSSAAEQGAIGQRNWCLNQGLLIFTGVFGCGTGMYYVGRSHPQNLILLYFVWALALAVLLWNVLNYYLRSWRISTIEHRLLAIIPLAFLFSLAATCCGAIKYTPNPILEIKRLAHRESVFAENFQAAVTFVKNHTTPNSVVAVVHNFAYPIANACQVQNVIPFSSQRILYTHQQMNKFLAVLNSNDVKKVFVETGKTGPKIAAEVQNSLKSSGYHYIEKYNDNLPSNVFKERMFGIIELWERN